MRVTNRIVIGASLALILTVAVGVGAPLHFLQAHSDTAPMEHVCAVCNSLSHNSSDVCDPAAHKLSDPSCAPAVCPDVTRPHNDCPTPRAPRGPPSFLA